ncbi:uncharacterized protein LOC123370720 isoform X2 [Mauremys mutica]|nr:uncharacterized protein LOC123370720 isoform X2 [Mauremys mutica]XP_044873394.1 uncharacterized protein LOC123370720 isoform X2 [Mauremys mutica]
MGGWLWDPRLSREVWGGAGSGSREHGRIRTSRERTNSGRRSPEEGKAGIAQKPVMTLNYFKAHPRSIWLGHRCREREELHCELAGWPRHHHSRPLEVLRRARQLLKCHVMPLGGGAPSWCPSSPVNAPRTHFRGLDNHSARNWNLSPCMSQGETRLDQDVCVAALCLHPPFSPRKASQPYKQITSSVVITVTELPVNQKNRFFTQLLRKTPCLKHEETMERAWTHTQTHTQRRQWTRSSAGVNLTTLQWRSTDLYP